MEYLFCEKQNLITSEIERKKTYFRKTMKSFFPGDAKS